MLTIKNIPKLEKDLLRAIGQEVDKLLRRSATPVQMAVRHTVEKAIKDSPEYLSLGSMGRGELGPELGLINGKSRADNVIGTLLNNITVKLSRVGIKANQINATMSIHLLSKDYEVLKAVGDATYISINSKGRATEIPWLEWLLEYGDATIIRNYEIEYSLSPKKAQRSRTGVALMGFQVGGEWRMPPQFSGTTHDNFLTRSIEGADLAIVDAIVRNIR